MKRRIIAGLLAVSMLLIVSCGKKEEVKTPSETGVVTPTEVQTSSENQGVNPLPKHDTLVLEVGEKSISKEDFEKNVLFQKYSIINSYGEDAFKGDEGAKLLENLRNKVQQDLAREQLFSIIAEANGVEKNMEEAEKIYKEEFLVKNTEETLKYFKDNKLDEDFVKGRIALETQIGQYISKIQQEVKESDAFKELMKTTKLVKASHILLPEAEEAKIKELKAELDKDPSRFEELAKANSTDGSAQKGGDLGYFAEGEMVKEFSDKAFSMEVGEISEPVKSQFGWHLIHVTDKGTLEEIDAKASDEESVKNQIMKRSQAEIIKIISEKTQEQEAQTPVKYYSLEN